MGDKNDAPLTQSQRAQELKAAQAAGGLSSKEIEEGRELFRFLLTRWEGPFTWITDDSFWNQLLNKQQFGRLVANPRVRVYVAHLFMGLTKSRDMKRRLQGFLCTINQATEAERSASSPEPVPLEARA